MQINQPDTILVLSWSLISFHFLSHHVKQRVMLLLRVKSHAAARGHADILKNKHNID